MKHTVYIIILSVFVLFPIGAEAQSWQDTLRSSTGSEMKKHLLNGLSIAVIRDYKIVWVQQWGVKSGASEDLVDGNTAFSTASISKPITALLCGILEEKGLIDLDDPIDNYLKKWHLPKSEFTKGIDVTWKHLLSHMAGTNQGGFADYYQGDKMPTLVQSLNGELLERQDGGIKFLFRPGTNWSYSGGGYVIIQLALEDHFGRPLSSLADEYLFKPLRLSNTTMVQPGQPDFPKNVAKAHDRKGAILKTGLPITPQVAPSGMWSTPADMATLIIAMQNALRGNGNDVISSAVAKRMTDIVTYQGISGYGIGWQRSLGFGNQEWFSHMGSNTGIGGEIMGSMTDGNGVVMFANGDVANRLPVFNHLRGQIFKKFNWNKPIGQTSIQPVPDQLIKAVTGSYLDFLYGDRGINQIFAKDGKLFLNTPLFKMLLNEEDTPMYYVGNNTFRINDYPNFVQFNLGMDQKLEEIVIRRYPADKHTLHLLLGDVKNLKTALIDLFTGEQFHVAKLQYEKLKIENPNYDFEEILNGIGALFYYQDHIDLCLQILEFNSKEHPYSWNVYDSLGEIYEVTQQYGKAIKNYEKAVSLSKSNTYKEQITVKIGRLKGL